MQLAWWIVGYALVGWLLVELTNWSERRDNKRLPPSAVAMTMVIWPVFIIHLIIRRKGGRRG